MKLGIQENVDPSDAIDDLVVANIQLGIYHHYIVNSWKAFSASPNLTEHFIGWLRGGYHIQPLDFNSHVLEFHRRLCDSDP